ncbi:MAG: methionyl-tRNA formyltransferase [bacterium]|nr:methionyl-tRNA formyltransferase [bacterium]
MRRLRVVFFGTPDIAVATLEALLAGPHEVVGIVSQPDRGRGRGRKRSPSPVSEVALREALPLLRPEKVGDAETVAALDALRPDVGVVVAFGQFIPKRVRELPTEGYLINAHASLLPKYRGAAPIARAILDGEDETGISVMRVEKEMDAGAVALVAKTPVAEDENAAELTTRLAELAASAIGEALDQIAEGTVAWTEQDASKATLAAKIEKHDSVLDLRDPARALVARIHAVSPKPGGAVTLEAEGAEPVLLKISRASSQPATGEGAIPGTLDTSDGTAPLRIATGDGWLVPRVMQRPGGKPLEVADFLRGFEIPDGARLAIVPHPTEDEGDAS